MKYYCFLYFIFFLCAFNIHPQNIHISTFLYQLQNLDLEAVGNTDFDLVIMDYSEEGDDETAYKAAQIETLKHSPGGDKRILSYLSIGEAESYRFYWQNSWKPGSPEWLDDENPEWEENYKVRYWYPEWQTIIMTYVDRILNAGFDGVYLDLIDAYETYLPLSSVQASREMVDFVGLIRDHASAVNDKFLIFVQNAAELAAIHSDYLDFVDGIGQEDIYYGYEDDGKPTPRAVTEAMQSNLDIFLNGSKTVLTIDYPFSESETEPHFDDATIAKIRDAYAKSRSCGYVPYCTVRELNCLTVNPVSNQTSVKGTKCLSSFQLYSNYPNPFNASTSIRYNLRVNGWVSIKVYDVLGRNLAVLAEGFQSLGLHYALWNASDFTSGEYFYSIETVDGVEVRRAVLVK